MPTQPITRLCFTASTPATVAATTLLPALELRLRDKHAQALAELLPVLVCGEESAALAFGRFASATALTAAAHVELEKIQHEEQQHEQLLSQVRMALPKPADDAALLRALRRFFKRLDARDLGQHFARIVALDSAACILFGAIRQRRSMLANEPALLRIFARIHRDETRHVLAARHYAQLLAERSQLWAIASETRESLVELLSQRGAALEQLGLDADRLLVRLKVVPRRLFA